MQLRDYQNDILEQLLSTSDNAIVQLETGAGKTPIEAALSEKHEYSLLIAHRLTLVRQLSEKLAAFGLEHDVIGTEHLRRRCNALHKKHGRSYLKRGNSKRFAVSIDSLSERKLAGLDLTLPWLIIIDEAHHVVSENKWGRLRELFPNARIVGFTATPARMDGESLHTSKGGLFDTLIQADGLENNGVRELIERGYLADFIAYAPPKLGRSNNAISLDYKSGELLLMAEPVKQYKALADGTKAILIAPAIKNAQKFSEQFIKAGIPAAAIHSTLSQSRISKILDDFEQNKLKVICNVDMIGEGFDMPDVQTLIIATLTKSFPRYRQWVGRVLRPSKNKPRAILIDLTGQIPIHGLPDAPVTWDLLDPPVGKTLLQVPCDKCGAYYKVRLRHCPECGAENAFLIKGEPLGNYEFDIKVINRSIVEQERQAINKERLLERRQKEIIWPDFNRDRSGIVGEVIKKLRVWFVDALRARQANYATINDFLESKEAADNNWWMKRFSASDLKISAKKAEKPMEVLKEWQLHSSTTTPKTTADALI